MAQEPQQPQGPSEQELRDLVMRTDQVRQQLAAMEAQREYIMEVASETRRALATLEHLAEGKPAEQVLVPLGAGVFLPARVTDPGKPLASLGNGVHAEMSAQEAAQRLKARVDNLDNAQQSLSKDIGRLSGELSRASAILETYYGG